MVYAEETVARLVGLIDKEEVALREIISELQQIADKLDETNRDMRIAKTSFGVIGIVSSALTIAGIAASPFTFGASLGLTIAGTALGVSCGAGGAATHIAGMVIEKRTTNKAQQKVNEYRKLVVELGKCVETVKGLDPNQMERALNKLRRLASNANTSVIYNRIIDGLRDDRGVWKLDIESNLLSGARVTTSASHVGVIVAKTVGDVVEGSVQALKIGGLVLSVVTVPLDIYSIVSNSIKIHKNSPSKTSNEIRRLVTFLTNIAEEQNREKALQNMRQEKEQALDIFQKSALKYDPANTALSKYKMFLLLLQVYGIFLTTISVFNRSDEYRYFGISFMIVMEVGCLILEFCIQANSMRMWPAVKQELNEIINQTFCCEDDKYDFSSVVKLFHDFKQDIENGNYAVNSSRDFVVFVLKVFLDILLIFYAFKSFNCTTGVAEVVTGMITLDGALALTEAATEAPQCLNPYRALVFLLTSPLCLFILCEMFGEMFGWKKSRLREHIDIFVEDVTLQIGHVINESEKH